MDALPTERSLTWTPSCGTVTLEEAFPFSAPPLVEEPLTLGKLLLLHGRGRE